MATLFERMAEMVRKEANLPASSEIQTNERKNIECDQKIQLVEALPVYVEASKLVLMDKFKNNANNLARALLIELVGKKSLETMCALGQGVNKKGIPENIREAIFRK